MADHTDFDDSTRERRRPSAALLVSGLAALLVAVWAFLGTDRVQSLGDSPFKWLVVAAAVIVGIVLVVSPGRRK